MNPFTWYIPSFNGDIRFEAEGEDRTVVKVIEPTAGEITRLKALSPTLKNKKWIERPLWDDSGDLKLQVYIINAPIVEVAKHFVADYAPGKATLTAIKFADDKVTAYETGGELWDTMMQHLGVDTARPRDVKAMPFIEEKPVETLKEDPEPQGADPYRTNTALVPKKAATVKRPTICCPACIEGPLTPAGEVLFAFLTDDEKQEYIENDHSLVVYGGITGHPYLVSHRHGKWARRQSKICRDLQNGHILHFHDHTVPPEEELLAAKLILEHRENWLRTEGSGCGHPVFPSPFGDGMDGTRSTNFTYLFGEAMTDLEEFFTGKDPNRQRGFTCMPPGGWS